MPMPQEKGHIGDRREDECHQSVAIDPGHDERGHRESQAKDNQSDQDAGQGEHW